MTTNRPNFDLPENQKVLTACIEMTQKSNIRSIGLFAVHLNADTFLIRQIIEMACQKRLLKYFNGNYVGTKTGKLYLQGTQVGN